MVIQIKNWINIYLNKKGGNNKGTAPDALFIIHFLNGSTAYTMENRDPQSGIYHSGYSPGSAGYHRYIY